MESLVLPVLLVVANVTGVGMVVPQVVHLWRSRTLDGVSAVWVGVGVAMNLWWIVYGLAVDLWGVLPVSMGAALLYGAMACLLLSIAGRSVVRPMAAGLVTPALVPLIGLATAGWQGAAMLIGLMYGGQFAPAAWTAVRSSSVAGVSSATWQMAWVEAVIWLFYGATTGDAALLVGGGGGVTMASVILIRLAFARSPRSKARPAARHLDPVH